MVEPRGVETSGVPQSYLQLNPYEGKDQLPSTAEDISYTVLVLRLIKDI